MYKIESLWYLLKLKEDKKHLAQPIEHRERLILL
jgi:hypothetical protein